MVIYKCYCLIYSSIFLLFAILGECQSYRSSLKNFEVLRLTAKTHHDSVILQELSLAHDSKHSLAPYTTSRKCIQDSIITFHIKDLKLVDEEFEGSECRLNTKENYQVIVSPIAQIHLKLHQDMFRQKPSHYKDIENHIIEKVENYPKLDLPFYDFESLNYDLECPIEYFEIGQVKLKQLSLETTLEKNVKMSPSCGFSVSDPDFDGSITTLETLKIPINGTFHCVNGRTSTCRRSIAQVSNARYRLLDY